MNPRARLFLFAPLLAAACASNSARNGGPAAKASQTTAKDSAAPSASGLDLAGMDRSVKPGDDWYEFVNGNWTKHTTIPADRTAWGGFADRKSVV